MSVFETARLRVRRLRPDDLDDFAALTGDPIVTRWMDDGQPLSRETTARWIEISLANYAARGWGCFGVTSKADDRLLGFAGFARPPARPGVVELIYAFAPSVWGRGYATEVAAGLVAFGFTEAGLTRIEATIDPDNAASRRVLAKAGMVYLRREANPDGSFTDLYAIDRPPADEPARD
jgi:RimJ/RimL family protein N-acetyltransferase